MSHVGPGRRIPEPVATGAGGDRAVEGRPGVVLVRIPGGDVPGEVRVSVRGTYENFIAYADEDLAVGTPVLVFNSRGPRAVDVMRAPYAIAPA